jgi:hypothetical protein
MPKRIIALGGIAAVACAAALVAAAPVWAHDDEEPAPNTSTPEPMTLALAALGATALGIGARQTTRSSDNSKRPEAGA